MFFGIRFDNSALYYFNLIFILLSLIPGNYKNNKHYQKILLLLFFIINSLLLATNYIDTKFFDFEHKRLTSDIFSSVWLGEDFRTLLPDFIKDYWYIIIIWVVMSFGLYKFYPKFNSDKISKDDLNVKQYFSHTAIFILLMGIGLIFGRGGFQLKPLRVIHAADYTSAKNIPLVLNTPFTIMKTIGVKSFYVYKYFDKEKLDTIYSPIIKYDYSERKKTNIVIIILESFSREYIGALNKGSGYTPFLDSLMENSLVYTRSFANGKRSMEAMPSIMAGLPALTDETYITSRFSSNKINSIANMLSQKAYYTAFFHGGKNGTMGFDKFTKIAGFDEYYGMDEYPSKTDYDGNWGIYDEEYLQYFVQTLTEFKEPFFTSVFTLTSHHPYEIPEKYKGKFPVGTLNIHESIGYTDYSLKKFFESAKKMNWYNNTLFIITADHTAQAESSYYKNKLGNYAIPIIFYNPSDSTLKGTSNIIAQQTDIFPTIMDYLAYDDLFICFGNSLLNGSTNHFTVNYINGIYQIIEDDYLLQFDGNTPIAFYNIKSDSLLQNNLIDHSDKLKEIETHLKAIIQSYQERLIENRLTVD
ncbi:MAG: sulfatase-like hydrolase/transferase [Bacteroidales bacterium]|nr:sulfatase-like hydrolase/transferase [Bacteroidales bacterium]